MQCDVMWCDVMWCDGMWCDAPWNCIGTFQLLIDSRQDGTNYFGNHEKCIFNLLVFCCLRLLHWTTFFWRKVFESQSTFSGFVCLLVVFVCCMFFVHCLSCIHAVVAIFRNCEKSLLWAEWKSSVWAEWKSLLWAEWKSRKFPPLDCSLAHHAEKSSCWS